MHKIWLKIMFKKTLHNKCLNPKKTLLGIGRVSSKCESKLILSLIVRSLLALAVLTNSIFLLLEILTLVS